MDLEQPRMPVRERGEGGKQWGADNCISSWRKREGAGWVHSGVPRCHSAPGQCQLDCLRNKRRLSSRWERENDDDWETEATRRGRNHDGSLTRIIPHNLAILNLILAILDLNLILITGPQDKFSLRHSRVFRKHIFVTLAVDLSLYGGILYWVAKRSDFCHIFRYNICISSSVTDRSTDKPTDRKTDQQTDRQTVRLTYRKTDQQTVRQTMMN